MRGLLFFLRLPSSLLNQLQRLNLKTLAHAIFAQESGNSQLNTEDRKTLREKVGDIEVTYANNSENRVATPALTFALSKIVRPAFEVMRS